MDENAPDTLDSQPRDKGPASKPSHDASAPIKTAAEYAGTFNKAVDVAEKVLRFAPLPAGAKRVAARAMPTVKKAAKVAPMVAPVAEPYVRKAVAKAKGVAPEVAQAAKTRAKTAAGHIRATAPKLGHAVSDGAKTAATRVHEDAPKLGHAAADKASRIAGKLKRKNSDSSNPPPSS
ncbi:hypothetical protein [Eggerthella timonensis]|uniref:hypothetical protein n=1 Tax=Eggerthella timonensis TaxID=1871008 RepID=UPI0015E06A2B|nr:hypothetical protein [Eggerthella timonensis]